MSRRANYPVGVPVVDRTEVPLRLRLRVAPGTRRSHVAGRHGDAWKLRVAAPAERGQANAEVVALLAETLGIPRAQITIVAGRGARDKLVELTGLGAAEAERRLAAVAGAKR
jgi:uncharacterized protein (TIGR00251 family)